MKMNIHWGSSVQSVVLPSPTNPTGLNTSNSIGAGLLLMICKLWYRVSLERRQFLRIQDAVLKIQVFILNYSY